MFNFRVIYLKIFLFKAYKFFKNTLIQKQGQVTLKDVEKTIQDLPLPEKIRALAIYKRYKQIRKMED